MGSQFNIGDYVRVIKKDYHDWVGVIKDTQTIPVLGGKYELWYWVELHNTKKHEHIPQLCFPKKDLKLIQKKEYLARLI